MVVDVQEAFRDATFGIVVAASARFVRGAHPRRPFAVLTEQYPQGLGPRARGRALEIAGLEKVVFSAARADGFDLGGRDQALVCGIETHVCVTQTVADLLDAGVDVQVATDAVSSRTAANRRAGLAKMEASGAMVTSTEMALFELLGRAGTPEFKEVQALVK